MNSAFGARWFAGPEVIIQVLFTTEQPKRNKMASSFASISEKEFFSMNEEAVPKSTKMATEFGVAVFNGKFILFRCFIVFIVIWVLDSFRKQGIAFWVFALEYEAGEIKCKQEKRNF